MNTQKQQQHTFRQHYEQSKHQQQHHQQQQNAPVPKQRELLDHLFEQYRKELRPVLNEQTVTEVAVQLYFKQIQKVKENDQIITVYCWLEEYWRDEFLRWDPARFGGIAQLHIPVEMIWRPDLLVYNNANMNVRESEMMTNALVQHDGRVSLFRAIITDITCHLNLHRFPFDQQICYLMLASWSYDGSQVMIRPAEDDKHLWTTSMWNGTDTAAATAANANSSSSSTSSASSTSSIHSAASSSTAGGGSQQQQSQPMHQQLFMKSTSLTHYIPNMEWSLIDFKTRSNLKWYDCCPNPYPDICYYFSIKRNPSYYLFTLIMPSALITTITVVGFFTPHSTTGENTEKVSLGVTSLLSLALILMMVSDKLPATSDAVPVLGQYYIGLICIQFTATYLTTWTLGLQMMGNSGRPMPRRLRYWLMSVNARKNFLVRHLLGRELHTAQLSIRHRTRKLERQIRKGGELLMADEQQQLPNFLYRSSASASQQQQPTAVTLLGTNNNNNNKNANDGGIVVEQVRLLHNNSNGNTINGGGHATAAAMQQNNRWAPPSPLLPPHVCGPFEQPAATKMEDPACGFRTRLKPPDPIKEIVETVQAIRQSLHREEQLREVRIEWQMLSRMIEKVLKLTFSVFTITFAFYMLYDEQAPPLITEEWVRLHAH